MIPPIIPLTSDTPRLHQNVSRSPVARRHASALPTKAAQIHMALRHHERNFATRSAHTLEANISHDTTNHSAQQRNAAFTPACFALPTPQRHGAAQTHFPPRTRKSQKSHVSLQNERFVRDFLQKSHVKSPKRAFRRRLPQKLTCQSLQNERFV